MKKFTIYFQDNIAFIFTKKKKTTYFNIRLERLLNVNVINIRYPIFSLGFGEGADIELLKKLSLNNSGFARVIYEGSDASFQLRNFYREISCLIMSNIMFKYVDTQVQIYLIYELYIMFCSLFVN